MKRLVLNVLLLASACRREAPPAAPPAAPIPVAAPAPPPEPPPVAPAASADAATPVVDATPPMD
jgi:hypothetical protein